MSSHIERFYQEKLNIASPFRYQIETWSIFEEIKFPLLLRAPTGSGKTEAVVAPFLYQFTIKKFQIAPRMIYVLPMRVLVNSIAERIKSYAQKISPIISVLAHHGERPDAIEKKQEQNFPLILVAETLPLKQGLKRYG